MLSWASSLAYDDLRLRYALTYFNIDLKNFFKKEIRLKSINFKNFWFGFLRLNGNSWILIWIQEGNLLGFFDLDPYRLKIVKTI